MLESSFDKELQQMCSHAYQEVAYYQELFLEHEIIPDNITTKNFYKIPFLSPEILQKNMGSFLATQFQKYPEIECIMAERSIGNQGFYLKTLWSKDDYEISQNILNNLRAQQYGIDKSQRFCCFHTASYRNNLIVDPALVEKSDLSISVYNDGLGVDSISRVYEDIMTFNPDYIVMQPSIAQQLSAYIQREKKNVPNKLKYMELTGESFSEQNRSVIQNAFGIKPVNSYSIKGINCIAYECEHGHMHTLGDNVYVEIIHDGQPVFDEIGEIVVTSLRNRAMPLIRYRTGDSGILNKSNCPCGNTNPILRITSARSSDIITLNGQSTLNLYAIKGLIEYTNEYMSVAISQVKVHRQDISVTLSISLKPAFRGWEKAVEKEFFKNADKKYWNDINWSLIFVK